MDEYKRNRIRIMEQLTCTKLSGSNKELIKNAQSEIQVDQLCRKMLSDFYDEFEAQTNG